MPAATILLIIQAIQAAIAAAPGVVDLVEKAKTFIDGLFTAKLITADQQTAMKNHVDSLQALALAGIVPPHWKVEPDPV